MNPDPSLRTELMALAAVLGETRPRFQKYGAERLLQPHEAATDLHRIADRIEAELASQQRVVARLNGHGNGNGQDGV